MKKYRNEKIKTSKSSRFRKLRYKNMRDEKIRIWKILRCDLEYEKEQFRLAMGICTRRKSGNCQGALEPTRMFCTSKIMIFIPLLVSVGSCKVHLVLIFQFKTPSTHLRDWNKVERPFLFPMSLFSKTNETPIRLLDVIRNEFHWLFKHSFDSVMHVFGTFSRLFCLLWFVLFYGIEHPSFDWVT